MLGPSWISLLRRIPVNLHDTLVMITATGTEIMVQKILILESDYLVFRGRMSGVQDSGLVMMMPYDQISNLAFNKRMLEPEVRQIFSGAEFVASAPAPAAATAAGENAPATPDAANTAEEPVDMPVDSEAVPTAGDAAAAEPKAESPAKPSQPSKSTLLARLRARLAGQSKS